MELRSVARGKASTSAAQVTAQHPSQQSRRSAASCTGEGRQVGRGSESFGTSDSTEVRGLQAVSKEARRAALAAQVEECQAFIQRLTRLEEERTKGQEELDAAQRRVAKFRKEMARTVPHTTPSVSETTQPGKIPDLVAELDRLRSQVKKMETEREEARKKRSRSVSVPSPDLVGGSDFFVARLGRTARRTRRARQRIHHGNVDQPREHVGCEFEPIQFLRLDGSWFVAPSSVHSPPSHGVGRKRSSNWGSQEPRPRRPV